MNWGVLWAALNFAESISGWTLFWWSIDRSFCCQADYADDADFVEGIIHWRINWKKNFLTFNCEFLPGFFHVNFGPAFAFFISGNRFRTIKNLEGQCRNILSFFFSRIFLFQFWLHWQDCSMPRRSSISTSPAVQWPRWQTIGSFWFPTFPDSRCLTECKTPPPLPPALFFFSHFSTCREQESVGNRACPSL